MAKYQVSVNNSIMGEYEADNAIGAVIAQRAAARSKSWTPNNPSNVIMQTIDDCEHITYVYEDGELTEKIEYIVRELKPYRVVKNSNGAPVYEAKVTMHGSRTLVPMTVVWTNDWGKGYVVGYVMPSGHCKRYNVDENWPCRSVEAAAGLLEELAAKRKWKPWPEDRPVECIAVKRS